MHQICMKNADITIYLRKWSKHSINPLRCDFGGNRSSICMGGSTEVPPPQNLETDPLTVGNLCSIFPFYLLTKQIDRSKLQKKRFQGTNCATKLFQTLPRQSRTLHLLKMQSSKKELFLINQSASRVNRRDGEHNVNS